MISADLYWILVATLVLIEIGIGVICELYREGVDQCHR